MSWREEDDHTAKTTTTHPSTTVAIKTTGTKPATTTNGGTGIETPEATQPDMVSNCNKLYYMQSRESCDSIAEKYGITKIQFITWDPKVGSACMGL